MLKIIVIGIIIMSATALYILSKLSESFKVKLNRFDKFINLYWVLTLFHATHILLVRQFFPDKIYLDDAAPYGLIYGPAIYFGLTFALEKTLTKRRMLIHLIPAFTGLFFYLIFVAVPVFRNTYGKIYFTALYSYIPVSMIAYVLWGTLHLGNVNKNAFEDVNRLFALLSVLIIVVAFLYLIVVYTSILPSEERITSQIPAFIIYSVMLAGVFFTFRFRIKHLAAIVEERIETNYHENKAKIGEETLPYQKSVLSQKMLDMYQSKLTRIMEDKKLYLDTDLSLSMLAKELKIPKHHLTQLFNVYIGKNFHYYINDMRIRHACEMLKDREKNLTIEAIANKSGFNSKVSFNRYFKASMGCTPSEYREKV